jgi:hypothetical protein
MSTSLAGNASTYSSTHNRRDERLSGGRFHPSLAGIWLQAKILVKKNRFLNPFTGVLLWKARSASGWPTILARA